jgi:Kef-type K+ transport system membrane component KefB
MGVLLRRYSGTASESRDAGSFRSPASNHRHHCIGAGFAYRIRFLGQPQVVGEVVAAIMLGPSFLGWVAPGISAALFPPPSIPYLNTLSELGVVPFMFLVGLSINPKYLNNHGHAA